MFLKSLSMKKQMAHRMQIQVKSNAHKQSSIDFEFMLKDKSDNKSVSHHVLQGLVHQKADSLCKKEDLLSMCKAYDVKIKNTDQKESLIKHLNCGMKQSGSKIPNSG